MIGARVPRIAHAGALLLSWLALGSCSDNSFSGDAFPVHIDLASGAVLVQVRRGGEVAVASLDIMSPITVFDKGAKAPVRRRSESLTVLGQATAESDARVPRAVLSTDVFDLRPCRGDAAACQIGGGTRRYVPPTESTPAPVPAPVVPPYTTADFGAVVGADALAGDAVRFDFPKHDLYILPDVAGGNSDRTAMCDAVFPSPFRGGGTVILDGAEVTFGGRRVTIGACLDADPAATDATKRGGDALLVASTGVGITILTSSAYERWRLATAPAEVRLPPFRTLRNDGSRRNVVRLASGEMIGQLVTLDHLALVATIGSNPRGPCNEVYTHHLLQALEACKNAVDCACSDETSCTAAAVVTLEGPITAMVVPDDNSTLQALRAELRPDAAEIDGILGTDAMRELQLDVDYPHNRVLMRCANPGATGCFNGRQVAGVGDRDAVTACNLPLAADAGAPAPTPAR